MLPPPGLRREFAFERWPVHNLQAFEEIQHQASRGHREARQAIVARDRDELVNNLMIARAEAESAFGDPSVYIEKYLPSPRHVEVQVFADRHGGAVYLGDRDCSIQRRHQKLIEESPSPVITPELRAHLGDVLREIERVRGGSGVWGARS